MRTPLVVVTGWDDGALDAAMMGLSWDLPEAVAVRHRIDAEAQVLTRVVSDATGVLEHVEMTLAHVCVGCALREDVLPTLERLAREDRWRTIVCCLPVAAQADQLCTAVASDRRLARLLDLTCVVAGVTGADATDDLLGEDLLADRGLHTDADDARGLGEVGCAIVERADVVVLDGPTPRVAADLARALARPDAAVLLGAEHLSPDSVRGRHHVARGDAWCSPLLEAGVPDHRCGLAWRLDLSSTRGFHPGRLLDHVEELGGGAHRSRGAFWLPTRPGLALEWGGCGGQLGIGPLRPWGRRVPRSRLLLTGIGVPPASLVNAFDDLLLTPAEAEQDWHVARDGLEPWLGDIDLAA